MNPPSPAGNIPDGKKEASQDLRVAISSKGNSAPETVPDIQQACTNAFKEIFHYGVEIQETGGSKFLRPIAERRTCCCGRYIENINNNQCRACHKESAAWQQQQQQQQQQQYDYESLNYQQPQVDRETHYRRPRGERETLDRRAHSWSEIPRYAASDMVGIIADSLNRRIRPDGRRDRA